MFGLLSFSSIALTPSRKLASYAYDSKSHKEAPSAEAPYTELFTKVAAKSQNKDRIVLTDKRIIVITEAENREFKTPASDKTLNRKTIETFKKEVIERIGERKLVQIEKDYGFSLDKLSKAGEPLLAKHVLAVNIGSNNIEMIDLAAFRHKIKVLRNAKSSAESNLHEFFLDYSKRYRNSDNFFNAHEIYRILQTYPSHATLGDFLSDFEDLLTITPSQETVDKFMKIALPSEKDWDNMYTGKKIQSPIMGSYSEASKFRYNPLIDQQELLQVFPDLERPVKSDSYYKPFNQLTKDEKRQLDNSYSELLVKVVVKKHLMRLDENNKWRVGELIPSPYRDKNGNTIWYRVEKGIDSGYGKMWFEFVPAGKSDMALPNFRVYRDTSPDPYAQGGAPTITRDLTWKKSAGYLYSGATSEQDMEYFREFSLPNWMANLYAGELFLSRNPENDAVFSEKFLISSLENLLRSPLKLDNTEKVTAYHIHLSVLKQWNEDYQQAVKRGKKEDFIKIYGKEMKNAIQEARLFLYHIAAEHCKDDYKRYWEMLKNPPAEHHIVGNSLGAFDAQFDIVKNLAYKQRVPIAPLHLYGHSGVRIEKADNERFCNYIKLNANVFRELGTQFDFRYILEDKDPVPKAGNDHTYLGESQDPEVQEFVNFDFRVVSVLDTAQNPTVKQLGTHRRRFENAQEGIDFKYNEEWDRNIEGFNENANNSWWEVGRKVAGFVVGKFSEFFWTLSRYLVGKRGLARKLSFHKIVVKYDEKITNSFFEYHAPKTNWDPDKFSPTKRRNYFNLFRK